MKLTHMYFLLLLILIPLPFLVRQSKTMFRFSSFSFLPKDYLSPLVKYALKILSSLLVTSIAVAVAGPYVEGGVLKKEYKGFEIVFVLDESGSMTTKLPGTEEQRIAMAKKILLDLIQGLTPDRIALIAFGGTTTTVSQFTFDHALTKEIIMRQDAYLGSTVFELGILRALSLFNSKESISNTTKKFIVVVSDGEGKLDNQEYIETWIKKLNIDFYWINVNSTPILETDNLSLFMRKLGNEYTHLVEMQENRVDIRAILKDINAKERRAIYQTEPVPAVDLRPHISKLSIGLAMCILISVILEWHFVEALRRR